MQENMQMLPKQTTCSNSFLSVGNPQTQLMVALQNNDFEKFKIIANRSNPIVDLNHVYKYPDDKTCLEMAITDPNKKKVFVTFLLGKNVQVNEMNRSHFAPLHLAVKYCNIDALTSLLGVKTINVNVQSNSTTALLMAVKQMGNLSNDNDKTMIYEEMIKLLLKNGCDPNSPDLNGVTPLSYACEKRLQKVVELIADVNFNKIPVDIDLYKDIRGWTARDWLNHVFPSVIDRFGTEHRRINVDTLFYYLHAEDEDIFIDCFITIVRNHRVDTEHILTAHNGKYTLLQLATSKGMDKAVSVLLDNGIDPNLTFSGNPNKPVAIASLYGFQNILQMLLNKIPTLDTTSTEPLLQLLVKGKHSYSNNSKADHKKCLKLLLSNLKIKGNINQIDDKGSTVLHNAARNGDQEIVLELLRNGACVGIRNKFNEPPLADISAKTLETYLDECVTDNEERPSNDNYEIQMNYSSFNSNMLFKDPLPETDALLYMTRNQELRPLLNHPIITSFLSLKWQRISYIFCINLTFYFLLWLCLNLYIFLGYGVEENQSNSIETLNVVTYFGTVIGLFLLILRELLQLVLSPMRYVQSTENLMEIVLIFVMTVIVCYDSVEESSKRQLSAAAILLSSAELVLLIGQFPTLTTNIVMLKTVSWNFFKFLLWYFLLILAFALSFYALFRKHRPNPKNSIENITLVTSQLDEKEEENVFVNPFLSLFKTIVMMTGEFDTGSIDFNVVPVAGHIIFIMFVFMIPIILFNLLNGLAVSDTQAIRADAELVGYVSKIEFIWYLENIMIGNVRSNTLSKTIWSGIASYLQYLNIMKQKKFWKKAFSRHITLFPNVLPEFKIIIKPNQENNIKIPHKDQLSNQDEENIENGGNCGFCCCKYFRTFRVDDVIINNSKAIIAKKNNRTEFDEIKNTLNQIWNVIRGDKI